MSSIPVSFTTVNLSAGKAPESEKDLSSLEKYDMKAVLDFSSIIE
jgi:hypothetical protein